MSEAAQQESSTIGGPSGNGQANRVLTDEMVAAIKEYLPRYPDKQAVTLPALHVVHERLRHVPLQAVVEIAELLELAPAEVQDTLTFYQFSHQEKPHGKTRIWCCRSISCALRDGEPLLDYTCNKLNIKPGGTTEDGRVTVEPAECLGACELAPCMLVGDQLYGNMTAEKVDEMLDSL